MNNHHSHPSSDAVFTHHFLVIETQNSPNIVYLSQESYTIGRQSDNAIVIDSDKVSRHHAILLRRKEKNTKDYSFWILDGDLAGNKSHNGIFVNQKRQFVCKLSSGDIIHISPEIKASYHVVQNSSEIFINVQGDKDFPNQVGTEKDTLVICESSLDNLQNHSTPHINAIQEQLARLTHEQLFVNYLDYSLTNAKRQENPLALGLLEITNFNDHFGLIHDSLKNELLLEVAQRLKSTLRKGDFIYYWQEGQFMILLPHLKEIEDLIKLSTRILRNFYQPFIIAQQSFNLKACLGLTVYPKDGKDSYLLIKNANTALSNTKKKQFLSSGFYDAQMNKKNIFVNRLDSLIKQAFDQDQFVLYYQPQVNITNNRIEGIEALLRWQHPSLGQLLPQKFLPLAEKGNWIISLGNWVLQNAYQQIMIWQNQGFNLYPISLNFCSQQFYNPHFIEVIQHTLHKTCLNPHLLQVEITEATFSQNKSAASRIIKQLYQLGIHCIIDSFSGRYISLQHLDNLPIKTIKLDQSLIENLQSKPQDTTMISAIITLGRHFDITISAKGVETPQQLKILKALQCHYLQGYLWSPPVAASDLMRYLAFSQHDNKEVGEVGKN